jgi:hypothetical protein
MPTGVRLNVSSTPKCPATCFSNVLPVAVEGTVLTPSMRSAVS